MIFIKKYLLVIATLIPCISFAQDTNKACYISYLTVRSTALDKDTCIFNASASFLNDSTRNHIALPDKYLFVQEYDSLIVLNKDTSSIGKTFQKIKNTSNMVKSMLGYNVSSKEEKHDMALIQPASEIYFENNQIAKYLCDKVDALSDTTTISDIFVVVSLLKVYANADLIADINRTAKIVGVATGGVGFVTGSVVKRALKATAGKGYSVIASNIVYRLDRESMTLRFIKKTNNYGVISKALLTNDIEKNLYEATMKALVNTEKEILKDNGYNDGLNNDRPLVNTIKEKWGKVQGKFFPKD